MKIENIKVGDILISTGLIENFAWDLQEQFGGMFEIGQQFVVVSLQDCEMFTVNPLVNGTPVINPLNEAEGIWMDIIEAEHLQVAIC